MHKTVSSCDMAEQNIFPANEDLQPVFPHCPFIADSAQKGKKKDFFTRSDRFDPFLCWPRNVYSSQCFVKGHL